MFAKFFGHGTGLLSELQRTERRDQPRHGKSRLLGTSLQNYYSACLTSKRVFGRVCLGGLRDKLEQFGSGLRFCNFRIRFDVATSITGISKFRWADSLGSDGSVVLEKRFDDRRITAWHPRPCPGKRALKSKVVCTK